MSEFGTGYAYCLGLFLAHADRELRAWTTREDDGASMWFNGAADHLYELEVPSTLPPKKRKEIEAWRDKCLGFRLCMEGQVCTKKDVYEALEYAKGLLLDWDKRNGVNCEKADYS